METKLIKFLADKQIIASLGEGRRRIREGAVKVNGEVIRDPDSQLEVRPGDVVKFVKRELVVE